MRNAGGDLFKYLQPLPHHLKTMNVKPVMFPPGCAKLETKP
jgi:hypothetical protein